MYDKCDPWTGLPEAYRPLTAPAEGGDQPTICVLCGSTRFMDAFREANLRETLAGKIVLSVGCDLRSDHELWPDEAARERHKLGLDRLHFRKIEMAHEALILNVGGYVGSSTLRELTHAHRLGKRILFLEPATLSQYLGAAASAVA